MTTINNNDQLLVYLTETAQQLHKTAEELLSVRNSLHNFTQQSFCINPLQELFLYLLVLVLFTWVCLYLCTISCNYNEEGELLTVNNKVNNNLEDVHYLDLQSSVNDDENDAHTTLRRSPRIKKHQSTCIGYD